MLYRRRTAGATKIDVNDYLTIEALEDGLTAALSTNACEYCIDGNGTWISLSANTTTQSINKGQTLSFRANLTPDSTNGIGKFTVSKSFNLIGNCMSMLYGDNAKNTTNMSAKTYAFYKLFYGCTKLKSVSANFLPATTLSTNCYRYMFYGCTSLINAPKLPAKTLTTYCYAYMFQGCSSLTTAPTLPATTLQTYCYSYMFYGCTALTTAPTLPATTLQTNCYQHMFRNCSKLTTAPTVLPATTLKDYCYSYMFYGCSSLTTAPTLPATTLASYCYQYMFYNCSKLTIAPALPATTLSTYCYRYMFYGCSSLMSSPELPAATLTNYCYQYMFQKCSRLNHIRMLATNISAASCLSTWVSGVASSGTFVKHPNMSTLPVDSINGIPTGWTVTNSSFSIDNYLTIEGLASGTISFSKACSYSINGGSWTSLSGGSKVGINAGQKISFKANLTPDSTNGIGKFTVSCNFNLMGNCMSMLYGDSVSKTLSGKNYAFYKLFYNCTTLQSVSANFLPATTLSNYCYSNMFYGCTSLTNAPTLPATTAASYCYHYMFQGCSKLTTAPELPATTLAEGCYEYMFRNCTLLTTAPELPATTLATDCYSHMFHNCISLTYTPSLVATTLAEGCYANMFSECESLTTVPTVLPATTLAIDCYFEMFRACTALTTAPELPARTLTEACYMAMFSDCTSLTTAPELPATTLALDCYYQMFSDCTSLTTAPELPATTLAENCYAWMFTGSGITTAPTILPAKTLAKSCYFAMFKFCINLTTAPELPAKILVDDCYGYMFCGCINLNYIKMLATDINSSYALDCWVSKNDSDLEDVSIDTSGTFVQDRYATWTRRGYNGIPTNWTVKSVLNTDDYLTIEFLDDHTQVSTTKANGSLYYFVNGDVERNEHNVSKSTLIGDSSVLVNDSGWVKLNTGSSTDMFNKGTKISFKQDRPYPSSTMEYGNFIVNGYYLNEYGQTEGWSDKEFNLTGNCMSMCYGDFAYNNNSLSGKPYVFYKLFMSCGGLKSVSKNFLPATTLAEACYREIFHSCYSLTNAPDLPATTLVDDCYYEMFYGCSSLINTPDLPATTLAPWCYSYMFGFCSSLTTAPDILPATTLAKCCYSSMFEGCSSLKTAPDLPATTLVETCYTDMFYECQQLNYIKMLATNATTSHLNNWVYSVASSGTFVKHNNATLTTGQSGIPTNWIVRSNKNKPSIYKQSNSVYDISFSYTGGGFYSPSAVNTVLSLTTSQLLSLTPDTSIIVDIFYKSFDNNAEKVKQAYTWYNTYKLRNVLEYIYGTPITKDNEDIVKNVVVIIKSIYSGSTGGYDDYSSGGGNVTPMPDDIKL